MIDPVIQGKTLQVMCYLYVSGNIWWTIWLQACYITGIMKDLITKFTYIENQNMSLVAYNFFFFPEELANIFPKASLMRLWSTWPREVSLLMTREFQQENFQPTKLNQTKPKNPSTMMLQLSISVLLNIV